MSQEVSKRLGSVGYIPNIPHLQVGHKPIYQPLILTSRDIQVCLSLQIRKNARSFLPTTPPLQESWDKKLSPGSTQRNRDLIWVWAFFLPPKIMQKVQLGNHENPHLITRKFRVLQKYIFFFKYVKKPNTPIFGPFQDLTWDFPNILPVVWRFRVKKPP